jgi:hypothetical protein
MSITDNSDKREKKLRRPCGDLNKREFQRSKVQRSRVAALTRRNVEILKHLATFTLLYNNSRWGVQQFGQSGFHSSSWRSCVPGFLSHGATAEFVPLFT